MTGRFAVIPAGYLILLRGDEVLMQLRQNTGYRDDHWALGAAGHVERGESAAQATVREAREELGIEIAAADLRPVCSMHRTGGNGAAIDERADFFFAAERWTGEPRVMEPAKCADLGWFALNDLPDPLVPHETVVLTALRTERSGGEAVPPILTVGW